jgi:seryl-tRNA synthetase
MLDIKIIRENPQLVKDAMKKRNKDMDALVDEVLAIDAQRRELTVKIDQLKQEQNAASKDIPRIKKEGGDISAIMARMNEIKEEVKKGDAEVAALEEQQQKIKNAKLWCIIGTVLGVLAVIGSVAGGAA